jgi:hypothetical protein
MITGPGIDLPNGIKIGIHTKEDIIALYGEDPWYEHSIDDLIFIQYEFSSSNGSGFITFYFDKNGLSNQAMIMYM